MSGQLVTSYETVFALYPLLVKDVERRFKDKEHQYSDRSFTDLTWEFIWSGDEPKGAIKFQASLGGWIREFTVDIIPDEVKQHLEKEKLKNKRVLDDLKLASDEVLVLKVVDKYLRAKGGFQYPYVGGFCEDPCWNPEPTAKDGLFGFLWGEGDSWYCTFSANIPTNQQMDKITVASSVRATINHESYRTLLLKVKREDLVVLDGKCKFKRGQVVAIDSMKNCTNLLQKYCPQGTKINFADITFPSSTKMYHNNITCGDYAQIKIGHLNNISAGDFSFVSVASESVIKVGKDCWVMADYGTIVSAGLGSRIEFTFEWRPLGTPWLNTCKFTIDGVNYLPNVFYKYDPALGLVKV